MFLDLVNRANSMNDLLAWPNMISLGSACRTRYQLERIYKPMSPLPTVNYPAFFWDWLYMGGAAGVIWCIENNFTMHKDEFTIGHLPGENLFVPVHSPSGFHFLHDYGGGSHDMNRAIASFKRDYDCSASKFSYLADRTVRFIESAKPCAFIFRGAMHNDHAIRLGQLVGANGVERFLVNLVGPNDNDQCSPLPEHPGILRIYFDDETSGQSWQGIDSSWDEVIFNLPISPSWISL
jgi:hypothetical protein